MVIVLVVLAVVILVGGVAYAARRLLLVVNVTGVSMLPTLRPGDKVLGLRRRPTGRLRRGCLVVGYMPVPEPAPGREELLIVKRVTALPGDRIPDGDGVIPAGHVWLRGDGTVTYDSVQFGPLSQAKVVARVVARLART